MESTKIKIEKKIREEIDIMYLEVVNESDKHRGHSGDDGSGQSHFKITIKSNELKGMTRVKAHKILYHILKEELKYIHALSIVILD